MPAERRFGMDHPYYDWQPVVARGALRWPNDARVALCVVIDLGHLEWRAPEGSYQPPNLAGGIGPRPLPEYSKFGHRDYGHRVGIFRVLDVLEKHGIRGTIAVDQLTVENYPYLVDYCLKRGCEIIGHGVAATRMITSNMSEEEEREYITVSVEALRRATGRGPQGWLGPEYGESTRTPRLLAEAGIRYVCDWVNDEQPYPLKVPQGELYALPILLDLDDVMALWDRKVPIDRYEIMLREAFDTLHQDGEKSGRLLALHLHPWLIGQPFRIKYLDRALGYMVEHQEVWRASGWDIINWYRSHPPAG